MRALGRQLPRQSHAKHRTSHDLQPLFRRPRPALATRLELGFRISTGPHEVRCIVNGPGGWPIVLYAALYRPPPRRGCAALQAALVQAGARPRTGRSACAVEGRAVTATAARASPIEGLRRASPRPGVRAVRLQVSRRSVRMRCRRRRQLDYAGRSAGTGFCVGSHSIHSALGARADELGTNSICWSSTSPCAAAASVSS